jgi:hypothetical protein
LKKNILITILVLLVHFSLAVSQTNLMFIDSIKISQNINIRSKIEQWYANETNINISVIKTDGKTYAGLANLYYPNYSKYIEGYINFKFLLYVKDEYLYIRYYNIIHSSENISFGLLLVNQPNLSNSCYLHADMCKVLWNDLVEYTTNHLMISTADLKYYFN